MENTHCFCVVDGCYVLKLCDFLPRDVIEDAHLTWRVIKSCHLLCTDIDNKTNNSPDINMFDTLSLYYFLFAEMNKSIS